MNFLNQKMSWTNAEFIPLKLCIASAFVLIGAHFSNFIHKYHLIFLGLFVITVIWTLYLWINKMKSNKVS
jgi:hypothetical protein